MDRWIVQKCNLNRRHHETGIIHRPKLAVESFRRRFTEGSTEFSTIAKSIVMELLQWLIEMECYSLRCGRMRRRTEIADRKGARRRRLRCGLCRLINVDIYPSALEAIFDFLSLLLFDAGRSYFFSFWSAVAVYPQPSHLNSFASDTTPLPLIMEHYNTIIITQSYRLVISLFAFNIIQFNVSSYHRACILVAGMAAWRSVAHTFKY